MERRLSVGGTAARRADVQRVVRNMVDAGCTDIDLSALARQRDDWRARAERAAEVYRAQRRVPRMPALTFDERCTRDDGPGTRAHARKRCHPSGAPFMPSLGFGRL
ncbi:MAG: hypothetical protein AB1689_19455 [Thermodesulfobacteriota bacterium]